MGLPPQWMDNGEHLTRASSNRHNLPTIIGALLDMTLAELKALSAAEREDYTRVRVGGAAYQWNAESVLAGDDLLVVEPDDGSDGRFLLAPYQTAQLSLPFTFATADAAALLTLPAGAMIIPRDFWWNVTADMTGGAGSAIGVSSTAAGYTTKGDLLGGATGDVAATLTAAASPTWGTIGAKWDTVPERRAFIRAGEVVRYDQITSAFTAGAGSVEMIAYIAANAGA